MSKFDLGRLLITSGAKEMLTADDVETAIQRHSNGDWGNLCDEDQQENLLALENGLRLLSIYHSPLNVRFYVLTECDRSATTILLPEEY